MKKPQLVIMAAGLGSRFGGLKQMAPVDPQNHWIIDYSIFDAVRAGFGDIILIVKPENEQRFRDTLGKRIGGAMVSPKHAGFLVNTGESAQDFLELMRAVQRIVEERTGIRLEPEIRIIGEAEA